MAIPVFQDHICGSSIKINVYRIPTHKCWCFFVILWEVWIIRKFLSQKNKSFIKYPAIRQFKRSEPHLKTSRLKGDIQIRRRRTVSIPQCCQPGPFKSSVEIFILYIKRTYINMKLTICFSLLRT